jgi:hypothetical protein
VRFAPDIRAKPPLPTPSRAPSIPPTSQHLPLDGGGWEGVREPRYLSQTTPSLDLSPQRGRVLIEPPLPTPSRAPSLPPTGQHLPLDGGGWEGVRFGPDIQDPITPPNLIPTPNRAPILPPSLRDAGGAAATGGRRASREGWGRARPWDEWTRHSGGALRQSAGVDDPPSDKVPAPRGGYRLIFT